VSLITLLFPLDRPSLPRGIAAVLATGDTGSLLLSQEESIVLRNISLLALLALVVAVPAQAENGKGRGKELKITGQVVKVTDTAVSVENTVGDAVLTCLVPERLAGKVASLEVGDKVRMICHRPRGRRAVLVRFGEARAKPERPKEEPAAEKKSAAGPVVELGANAIVVQGEGVRLACKVSEEKAARLAGLKLGDKVKIACLGGQLVALERYQPSEKPTEKPAGDEARLYGKIAELSRASVTVRGEAGSLTCSVPAEWAEKVVTRFAVGDSVKLMCRGSVVTYLEKVA
jgi:hypothetical protein